MEEVIGIPLSAYFFPALFIALTLIAGTVRKHLSHYLGKIPQLNVNIIRSIIAGFILLLVAALLVDKGSSFLGLNDTQAVQAWAAFLSQHLFGTIIFVAIGALAEEMFFRGALQHELGKWPSIILFALAHASYFSIIQLLGALLAGIILAQMRERTQSIFPGFISHAAYNLVAVFFLSGI